MSIEAGQSAPQPPCMAARLTEYVDRRLNAGAIAEFEAADSGLKESDADSNVGSEYLDDSVVEFTPCFVKCVMCRSSVGLTKEGNVIADQCPASGSCEVQWAANHPEGYRNGRALTAAQVACRAEVGCFARVAFTTDEDGELQFEVVRGGCAVDRLGTNWKQRGAKDWREADVKLPERGIEEFDGEQLGAAPDEQQL